MLVPVGAKHLETTYLAGRTNMASYAGTDIIVSDSYKTDSVARIGWQTVCRHIGRQGVEGDELEGDRQILVNQLVHAPLYLFLLLPRRLVVKQETHLTLLPLNMGIEGTVASKEPNHGLIQQVLCRVSGRELLLVVVVQDVVVHWCVG